MTLFRIQPHGRLQEWVAEEKGYFKDEGLKYEFIHGIATVQSTVQPSGAVQQVKNGAFESFEAGRDVEVSSACHWAVNMASSTGHGRMWGHAYSVAHLPASLCHPNPPSALPPHLANVEVSVGYHSGSHFSTLSCPWRSFWPRNRSSCNLWVGPIAAWTYFCKSGLTLPRVFSSQYYIVEQQGYRKVVDCSFMIGFLFSVDADVDDVAKYFNALRRAQRDIDLDLGRYKHYYLRELPEEYHKHRGRTGVRARGTYWSLRTTPARDVRRDASLD